MQNGQHITYSDPLNNHLEGRIDYIEQEVVVLTLDREFADYRGEKARVSLGFCSPSD